MHSRVACESSSTCYLIGKTTHFMGKGGCNVTSSSCPCHAYFAVVASTWYKMWTDCKESKSRNSAQKATPVTVTPFSQNQLWINETTLCKEFNFYFFRNFSLGDIFFNSVSIYCVTVVAKVSQLPRSWSHLEHLCNNQSTVIWNIHIFIYFQWPMEWIYKLCSTNAPLAAHIIFCKIIWQLITKVKCWASGSSR